MDGKFAVGARSAGAGYSRQAGRPMRMGWSAGPRGRAGVERHDAAGWEVKGRMPGHGCRGWPQGMDNRARMPNRRRRGGGARGRTATDG